MIIRIKKRNLAIILSCMLLMIIIFAYETISNFSVSVSAGISNWGLKFNESGTTPIGNETRDYLKKYNAYYAGNNDEKVIFLTFDAGYENGYTQDILDTLKKHDVKAAFFLVGHYIEKEPGLVKRMIEEGHIVGNHTYSHPDMSKIADADSFKKELNSLEDIYKQTTGQDMPKYYRPPQGKFNEENLKMANEMGYKTIFWSLAYQDWSNDKQPTRETAFEKLIPRIHPGAVVLLHSTSKTNSEILDELLTKWKEMGYTFKTIDELVQGN
ncbi:delta-lactam-biosynthetic de-N-acetylase [Sedimentibacter sp. B4]|uniref:delta-lactam-biosynthetic de-N-acetylase n=1 Tax=Sedimentibacter sp. B4 TaxID=304766 RepID=UPI0002FEF401|nr:delta-lactam-biosynthetic de-N-acetylase [Sedimentibacter sp. B4]